MLTNGKFRPRPARDSYPTPQAITEQEFENHVRQQEKKEQTQPSADGQQPPATAGETPDEASPAADGKTDKASAAWSRASNQPSLHTGMNNEQHQNTHTSDAPAIPSPFQKRTCWHALTGVSILVMLGIAAFVIFEVVELLGFLEPVLLPILIAAVVAYLLEPIVSWLVRLKFSRPWAVVTGHVCGSGRSGRLWSHDSPSPDQADG